MLKLKINQLKNGMILSRDVSNFSGVMLLKSGCQLKTKDIKNFKAWGITETFVQESMFEGKFQKNDPKVDPKVLKEAKEETAVLFRHTNSDHPIVMELKRLCTLNKIQQKTSSSEFELKSH